MAFDLIRVATRDESDLRFLREMLYEAAVWRPESTRRPLEDVLAGPGIGLYLEGWGRPGDFGLIAEADGGEPVGAVWLRLFTEEEHGYGFVSPSVPELSIGVSPPARGRGVGTSLIAALVERARAEGYPALSLSVEEDNSALRLYERLGFVRSGRVGDAWTMRRELSQEPVV